MDSQFEDRVCVLVAGGGAAGAVAALAAHAAGAQVLLIEQDAHPAGTTALSQGLICAAGTAAQRVAGVEDGPQRFAADILAKTRGLTDPGLVRAIAGQAGASLDWLVEAHDLPHRLDHRFRAGYGHSVTRVHGWLGHGGADLIGFLHHRVAACGIDVLTQARLAEVVAGATGPVAGVVITRPDGTRERIGCDALVLATGGFAANAAMVARHMPAVAGAIYNGHAGSTGAGQLLGAELGGALADMGAYQGYAMLTEPQGVTVPPGFLAEGGLLVNAAGRRFADESEDISGLVLPVLAQPGGRAWLVYDAAIEGRCGYIPETATLVALNAARQAADAGSLAAAIGAGALDGALAEAAAAAAAGRPDAVGRRWAADTPPPRRALRALRVRGALYHTQGGLQVDGDGGVLRGDGRRLGNLYAAGGAARGVSGPSCWGYLPAMGLCAAVTLGRLAGTAAARAALPVPP